MDRPLASEPLAADRYGMAARNRSGLLDRRRDTLWAMKHKPVKKSPKRNAQKRDPDAAWKRRLNRLLAKMEPSPLDDIHSVEELTTRKIKLPDGREVLAIEAAVEEAHRAIEAGRTIPFPPSWGISPPPSPK